MKILVFKLNKRLVYTIVFSLIIVLILLICFLQNEVISVFVSDRELPIYSVDTDEKIASITFDCAWGADDIPNILKTLRQANVKATFFFVGQWAEKFPYAVKMIASEGHDIANHSYSHLRMSVVGGERLSTEIQRCGDILGKMTNSKIELFRAPYGDYNNSVIASAKRLGYFTIQWNVDSLDWKPDISKEEIMSRICNKIVPGSIILFHNDTKHTANILPDIISALKEKGYVFLPVSKMILRDNYIIDYEGRQKKH